MCVSRKQVNPYINGATSNPYTANSSFCFLFFILFIYLLYVVIKNANNDKGCMCYFLYIYR